MFIEVSAPVLNQDGKWTVVVRFPSGLNGTTEQHEFDSEEQGILFKARILKVFND